MATTALPALERPLCVDLDGTLVKSDTLVDSLLLLIRTYPLRSLQSFVRVKDGKAAFKAWVTAQVTLDVSHLPYNRKLLEYLGQQRCEGRKLYLTTGADATLAQRVADHLKLFDRVLASDGATNLTGNRKLDSLKNTFAGQGFDYIGNATPD